MRLCLDFPKPLRRPTIGDVDHAPDHSYGRCKSRRGQIRAELLDVVVYQYRSFLALDSGHKIWGLMSKPAPIS